jgi:hypothetical protein
MKNFEEWKKDIDSKIEQYEMMIQQKEMELVAIKAIRDSYVIASYPLYKQKDGSITLNNGAVSGTILASVSSPVKGAGYNVKYGAGMEDCGK